jgi:mRNA interferase MazF
VKRGTIYWVDLEPASPPELGKTRPAIVISNSMTNQRLRSVVVVPLSSRAPEIWPLRMPITMPHGATSYAIVPGIRQVDKRRLRQDLGRIPARDLKALDEAISVYLND